ncbi:MAG TPA: hypothetical protein VHX87_08950 [Galbitalea sp.]|jgi:sRNA-binding protein|nr:hypothetical protein [Galbitalea sp.]
MKKSLLIIAVGVGIGYILGARAGRERYDLIVEKVTGVWEDPRVAKARAEAARYAREQGPVIRDRAAAAAKAAPGVVADRARATAAATDKTARKVANTAAARAGEARDAVLETDDDF